MSDSEDTKVHKEEAKSKSKHVAQHSDDSSEPSTDSTAESEGEKVDVPYDPNAKPAKSILKKPGDEGHKAEGHIHIASTDDGIHDAEKKKGPKKPMPVEGRSGVIVGGKTKRTISRGGLSDGVSSSSAPAAAKDVSKDKDDKDDKKDKKDKKEKEKKDKKEKEKEKEKKKEKK